MFVADCYNQTGFEPAINCSGLSLFGVGEWVGGVVVLVG